jgi:hypothetical protein
MNVFHLQRAFYPAEVLRQCDFKRLITLFFFKGILRSLHYLHLSGKINIFSYLFKNNTNIIQGVRGSTVVKILSFKSEGSWFDPRWCHGSFQ